MGDFMRAFTCWGRSRRWERPRICCRLPNISPRVFRAKVQEAPHVPRAAERHRVPPARLNRQRVEHRFGHKQFAALPLPFEVINPKQPHRAGAVFVARLYPVADSPEKKAPEPVPAADYTGMVEEAVAACGTRKLPCGRLFCAAVRLGAFLYSGAVPYLF